MNRKPCKVVFIITGLGSGGAENMLCRLLERIDRDSFECHLISLTTLGEKGERIRDLRISVDQLGMRRGIPGPLRFLRLVRQLRRLRPDIVHTWLYHSDLIGGLAAWFARCPALIWGIRSSDFVRADTSLRTRFVLSLCTQVSGWLPDCVIYNSQKGGAYHMHLGYRARRSIVIPNGIDLGKFNRDQGARESVRQELGISADALLVGLIARYDPLKNHEAFLKAAARIHEDMPQVHFLLVGANVELSNPTLRDLIKANGLADVCHLVGERSDIPRLTASLDLATLTSWSEGFPNVLVEAMACGVPCVSTDAGDAKVILGETGRIVPPGDPDALADQVRELLRLSADERRDLGTRARNRAQHNFEIATVVKHYEAAYREIHFQRHQ